MFAGRYFSKRYYTGRYWSPPSGLFVQVGGFGQVVGFGVPTVGIAGGPLLIEVPSLSTLLGFGLPSVSGGLVRPARLFVSLLDALWRLVTRPPGG